VSENRITAMTKHSLSNLTVIATISNLSSKTNTGVAPPIHLVVQYLISEI